ncbi:MAG: serine hydrolase [Bacteroidetes bacterium]|nr:serine hydrolase [Bacteroidota bacterium]
MNRLKKGVLITLSFLLCGALLIQLTNNNHVYRAVAYTYLKGRTGPGIEDHKYFKHTDVVAKNYRALPNSSSYNKKELTPEELAIIEKYKTEAFLVIKNDSVVYEHYWDGYSEDSRSNSFSMAKTIVSILVGIAINEGKIKNIDQPVADFIPSFKVGVKQQITIRHLVTMSSGIGFDEHYKNPLAYPAKAYYGKDINKLTLGYEATEQPGKVFNYLSGNTQLLGIILESATGLSLNEYASQKLWNPINAKNTAWWDIDDAGNEKAYCCFNSNARDFSRIGLLYLHKGKWNDKQIVSEQYASESVVPANLVNTRGEKNTCYGYSWWIMNYKTKNIFYARGILGQYVFVVPSENLVVVRLGWDRAKRKETDDHSPDAYSYLDIALNKYATNN